MIETRLSFIVAMNVLLLPFLSQVVSAQTKPRARDLGIPFE
jgi:hypothetical protein